MPYKSDAQRRFFHTDTAKKAGITDKEVNEFDKASKGMKLPEHAKKMAYGGETNAKHETLSSMENNPTAGFAKGGEAKKDPNPFNGLEQGDNGTLVGLRDLLRQKAMQEPPIVSSTTPHMADGGDISDALSQLVSPLRSLAAPAQAVGQAGTQAVDAMNPLMSMGQGLAVNNINQQLQAQPPQGTPPPTPGMTPPTGAAPGLGDITARMQNTPSTDPSIYQGITADDRAALMQKLMAQRTGGANAAVSGAAGLGDAIARSFGGQNTNYQQGTQENLNKNQEMQIGAIDTQRQQRIQDLQANIAQQEANPKSPYSEGMRQFLSQLTGKPMPSGISAQMLKGIFPDYVKIFDAQMQAATAKGAQAVEAGKATQGFWSNILDKMQNPSFEALQKTATGGKTAPANTGGWSVKR